METRRIASQVLSIDSAISAMSVRLELLRSALVELKTDISALSDTLNSHASNLSALVFTCSSLDSRVTELEADAGGGGGLDPPVLNMSTANTLDLNGAASELYELVQLSWSGVAGAWAYRLRDQHKTTLGDDWGADQVCVTQATVVYVPGAFAYQRFCIQVIGLDGSVGAWSDWTATAVPVFTAKVWSRPDENISGTAWVDDAGTSNLTTVGLEPCGRHSAAVMDEWAAISGTKARVVVCRADTRSGASNVFGNGGNPFLNVAWNGASWWHDNTSQVAISDIQGSGWVCAIYINCAQGSGTGWFYLGNTRSGAWSTTLLKAFSNVNERPAVSFIAEVDLPQPADYEDLRKQEGLFKVLRDQAFNMLEEDLGLRLFAPSGVDV
jgi:hypothetical protein